MGHEVREPHKLTTGQRFLGGIVISSGVVVISCLTLMLVDFCIGAWANYFNPGSDTGGLYYRRAIAWFASAAMASLVTVVCAVVFTAMVLKQEE